MRAARSAPRTCSPFAPGTKRIRRTIETNHLPGEARVTISVGVAAGRADDVSTLIARADGALYAAKDGGRNRIAIG